MRRDTVAASRTDTMRWRLNWTSTNWYVQFARKTVRYSTVGRLLTTTLHTTKQTLGYIYVEEKMPMSLIEKTGFCNAPLLNIDQIPEYPEDLLNKVCNGISKEYLQSISARLYNEIAPGQLLGDRRVLDFIIYTNAARWEKFLVKNNGCFQWTLYASTLRMAVRNVIQAYYRVAVTTAEEIDGLERLAAQSFPFRTQKVRGMAALISAHTNYSGPPYHPLIGEGSSLLKTAIVLPYQTDARHLSKMFARPCPSRPRHGFVESRCVLTTRAINQLFQQAKMEDPDAEMVVMALANGRCSALSVPNMLTLADGFSGCTAGDSGYSVSIPHTHIQYSTALLERAGVNDTPYIEYVEHNGRMAPVQLRDGPAVDGGQKNYIPHDIPPDSEVLFCDGDLIAYEQKLRAADPKKSVVFGVGKSLTSHYGAHAISFGIPFIVESDLTYRLRNGIKKNTDETHAAYYGQIANRLKQLIKTPLAEHARIHNVTGGQVTNKLARSVAYALTVAHLCPVWPKDRCDLNYITANGLFHFIGGFAAALLGELRHLRHATHNGKLVRITTIPKFRFNENRNSTFGHATQIPVHRLIECLAAAEVDFLHSVWSSSYGGGPWASAAMALHTLVSRAYTFMVQPDANTWGALLRDWHTCINEQHNGGYVLNKFIPNGVFNAAADTPTHLILTYRKIYEYYLREAGVANGKPPFFHFIEEEE